MRRRKLRRFYLALITAITGIYFGLTSFTLFAIFFIIITIIIIGCLVVTTCITLSAKANITIYKLFMYSIAAMVLCVCSYNFKNYLNKQNAETVLIAINHFAVKNHRYPANLSQLTTQEHITLPKYFYNFKQIDYIYTVNSQQTHFILEYNNDGLSNLIYTSTTQTWTEQE